MLVLSSAQDKVATITLNRPDRHNSLVPPLLEELISSVLAAGRDSSIRAVILQANGWSFSTGGDMKGFQEHLDDLAPYANKLVGLLNEAIVTLVKLSKPTIAAVQGIVTGGSLGLVIACDIVIVTQEASFTPYYSEVGFSPDGAWTAILPDIIGQKRAASVIIGNQTISAQQAIAWGLASQLVPSGNLRQAALATAQTAAKKNAGAIYHAKRLLLNEDIVARLDIERSHFVEQIATAEAREGIISFKASS